MTTTQRAGQVIERAIAQHLSIATAESLTAGLIAAELATVPGASAVLRGGVVSYASEVKSALLGVDEELLATAGSVDPQVAEQMALGARRACGADLAVSATGVAGPEPHDGKGVGTVYIGWAYAGGSGAQAHHFVGGREAIRAQATQAALQQLIQLLEQAGGHAD